MSSSNATEKHSDLQEYYINILINKCISKIKYAPVLVLILKILIHRNDVPTWQDNTINDSTRLVLDKKCTSCTEWPRQNGIEFVIQIASVKMKGFIISVPPQLRFPVKWNCKENGFHLNPLRVDVEPMNSSRILAMSVLTHQDNN